MRLYFIVCLGFLSVSPFAWAGIVVLDKRQVILSTQAPTQQHIDFLFVRYDKLRFIDSQSTSVQPGK